MVNKRTWSAIGCTLAAAALAWPAAGQQRALAALDRLQGGLWELRVRDTRGSVERLCVNDGRRMIQLRHQGNSCEHYVVDDQANDVTVQYTCRGRGYGRTHIHRESAQLAQIETQGIAQGFPFNFVAEARRVGSCG